MSGSLRQPVERYRVLMVRQAHHERRCVQFKRCPGLQGAGTAQQSGRKQQDAAYHLEHPVNRHADDPERDQKDPDERVDDQRQQGDRPADHEQDAPQQEFRHTWEYDHR